MPWREYNPPGRVNPDINNWRDWNQRNRASTWMRAWNLAQAPTTDPWGNTLRPEVANLFAPAFAKLQQYSQSTGKKPISLMRHPDRYANNDSALTALRDALLKYQRPFLDQPAMGALAAQAAPPLADPGHV